MSNLNQLKINPDEALTSQKWNELVENVSDTALKIVPNALFVRQPAIDMSKKLVIDEKGYVGIGTDTPQEALHIMGNIRGNQQGGALRIQTEHGYLDIGAQSSGWMHLLTDRSSFHFNRKIDVKGQVSAHEFRFGNGSVQKKASVALNIRSGRVFSNTTGDYKKSNLIRGRVAYTPWIKLTGFSETPHIMVAMHHLDSDEGENVRISVNPYSVSASRFKVQFSTWSKTKVYNVGASWIAIGK